LPHKGLQPQSAVVVHEGAAHEGTSQDGAPHDGAAHDGAGVLQTGAAQPQEAALVHEFALQHPCPNKRVSIGWQWPHDPQPLSHALQPQCRLNSWCGLQRLGF